VQGYTVASRRPHPRGRPLPGSPRRLFDYQSQKPHPWQWTMTETTVSAEAAMTQARTMTSFRIDISPG